VSSQAESAAAVGWKESSGASADVAAATLDACSVGAVRVTPRFKASKRTGMFIAIASLKGLKRKGTFSGIEEKDGREYCPAQEK
jgi:hypothetical protein